MHGLVLQPVILHWFLSCMLYLFRASDNNISFVVIDFFFFFFFFFFFGLLLENISSEI